jgi:flavin-binding protein dodecin
VEAMAVIKVIELVGQSKTSWEDAVKAAVKEASKTIRHISGVEVLNWTGRVDDDEIVKYRANVKIAFKVTSDD